MGHDPAFVTKVLSMSDDEIVAAHKKLVRTIMLRRIVVPLAITVVLHAATNYAIKRFVK